MFIMPVIACNLPTVMEKSRVRRCLFGKPDHDSLRKDLDDQLKATKNEMRNTWNFDSDEDRPLAGRYEWTLLSRDDVPSFYCKGYRPSKFRSRSDICDVQESDSSLTQCTPFVSRIMSELDDEEEAENIRRENETTPELRTSQRQSRIDGKFLYTCM